MDGVVHKDVQFFNPALALQRLVPVLAGKISLRDFREIYTIITEDTGERYHDLTAWLEVVGQYLPVRSHSKVGRLGLSRFVWKNRGWFRVKDFAAYFQVHEKTAWEYLKVLHRGGLVTHNGERSSRARYRIDLPGAIE